VIDRLKQIWVWQETFNRVSELNSESWPRGSVSYLSVSSFGKGQTRLSRVRGISVQIRRGSLRNSYHI
jgi:hypothetical protein